MAEIRRKLVVIGDGTCGKTCLLIVYTNNQFPQTYLPTVFETFVKDLVVNDRQIQLGLWDTAGQDDYDRLRPLSYYDTDILLICFSISDPDSFNNVTDKWYPEAKHYCPGVPIILVGNKKDLRNDPETLAELTRKRQSPVTTEDGKALAARIGAVAYMECSAKNNEGVREIFEKAASHPIKYYKNYKGRFCRIF
ncbi:unnamed protein product [Candidula unifasciata]|uniref:Uncharacterized protein n=1 Tax=Candidula unifasciata TaxID=100452 RepID=A0A8S3ZX60_9EUPU|nr:unnamed protein product [Candidula unifasciata]